jgi:hypothetical protein
MQQLYQYGLAQGRGGPPWRKNLPATYTAPSTSAPPRVVPAGTVSR